MGESGEMTLEILEEENVRCCKCENNGDFIQDIADWVDDE